MDHVLEPATADFARQWHFSHVVRTRGLLLLSGVTGTRVDGSVDADPEQQFEQLFAHLRAYLAAADADLSHVAEITTYHVDLHTHFDAFVAVKDRHFAAPYPAWSAIGVSTLITPGAFVELRAVAEDPAAA